jgi:hypothetical protein
LPCVADWDSTSYTSTIPHCLRRVDLDLHYPADLSGEVRHDGQIWSRALWDIRQALGNVKADTIILQGSFDFPGTTMPDLATRTVAAAQQPGSRPQVPTFVAALAHQVEAVAPACDAARVA